jgi:anti-repressor protein
MSASLTLGAQPITMTSREIADLVELRHDNVRRTIETLAARGVITLPQSEEVSNDGPGPKTISVFRVGKRDSYVVVAQLSPEFTARLVDRWQELEAGAAPALNLRDIRQLAPVALQLANLCQEQQAQIAVMAPKAEFFDAVTDADGGQSVNEVAKVLGVGERKLRDFMRKAGIFMQHAPLPLQEHVDAGRFRVIERTFDDGKGFSKNYAKALVTGRGLQYLQRKLAEAGLYGGH